MAYRTLWTIAVVVLAGAALFVPRERRAAPHATPRVVGAPAPAGTNAPPDRLPRAVALGDLAWQPGPLPGTRSALLAGDPQSGMHHGYLELQDGARIPAHRHRVDEYVTVLSGEVLLATGDDLTRAGAQGFGPGAFVYLPAGVPHAAWARGTVLLSQTRSGPVDFQWLDPNDDPARRLPDASSAR